MFWGYHHLRKHPYVLRKGDPLWSSDLGIETINPTEGFWILRLLYEFLSRQFNDILCQQNKLTPLYNMLINLLICCLLDLLVWYTVYPLSFSMHWFANAQTKPKRSMCWIHFSQSSLKHPSIYSLEDRVMNRFFSHHLDRPGRRICGRPEAHGFCEKW